MREIKFRGFSEDLGKWVFGDLSHGHENIFIMVNEEFDGYSKIKSFVVKPETVGQFIGVTDKNLRDIYEGDIVRETEEGWGVDAAGVVKFYGGSFYLDNGSEEHWSDDSEFEVIGNVHEHPELLTPKEEPTK